MDTSHTNEYAFNRALRHDAFASLQGDVTASHAATPAEYALAVTPPALLTVIIHHITFWSH
jgi:hypothetical protein